MVVIQHLKPHLPAPPTSPFHRSAPANASGRNSHEVTQHHHKSKVKQQGKILTFFGMGNVEPREINFVEMCYQRYPSRTWNELNLQEQVDLIRNALKPRQHLLDPNCNYLKYWDTLVLFALLYTSIVTPYEVGFMESTGVNGLFIFNRGIDCLFLKDMMMQFFLKIQVHELKGTIWIKDRRKIAERYLKGWFVIDLFSILPFDVMGMVMNDPAMNKLKAVRIIRLLRLLKLVRVFRASRIMKRWQNRTSISYSAQGLCKFGVLLTIAAHWMACIWGMVGRLFASDLVCYPDGSPEDEAGMYSIETSRFGGSWVTGHSWGPQTPCNHFDVYIAALHFAVMTITSIGYGDIIPTRIEEYILCIICQLGGGLTWAYVIGSICGIIANANPMRVQFEQSMDALNKMLTEQGVEHELRWKLREYLREQQYHHLLEKAMSISEAFSPILRGNLILETAIGRAIKKVWYFSDCETNFVVEVARSLEAELFSPREYIGGLGTLSLVARGSIARSGRILLPGNFWGEDMIISSDYLADETPGIALSFVEILSLRKPVLEKIIEFYPSVSFKIRRAALLIAFRNAVRIVARERLNQARGSIPFERSEKTRKTITRVWSIFDAAGVQTAINTKLEKKGPPKVDPLHHATTSAFGGFGRGGSASSVQLVFNEKGSPKKSDADGSKKLLSRQFSENNDGHSRNDIQEGSCNSTLSQASLSEFWQQALLERFENVEAEVVRCRADQSNVLEELKSVKNLLGALADNGALRPRKSIDDLVVQSERGPIPI
eukprot:gnl/MRDRNA2_/MRDRNA2_122325_c0_seq1.p1 gnl/MRDRNA2_/MRDRNA2_122325_c0~~gnl/MRDRNA2_/MRDRNA2_122325_c0_seq1.p1  ORF type:complete len:775 (-),score=115.46 gnl/MRDRNA2_/MRDRNA2_122325_c0_seq1:69-2393(-)